MPAGQPDRAARARSREPLPMGACPSSVLRKCVDAGVHQREEKPGALRLRKARFVHFLLPAVDLRRLPSALVHGFGFLATSSATGWMACCIGLGSL